jgi:hypothetical protein
MLRDKWSQEENDTKEKDKEEEMRREDRRENQGKKWDKIYVRNAIGK